MHHDKILDGIIHPRSSRKKVPDYKCYPPPQIEIGLTLPPPTRFKYFWIPTTLVHIQSPFSQTEYWPAYPFPQIKIYQNPPSLKFIYVGLPYNIFFLNWLPAFDPLTVFLWHSPYTEYNLSAWYSTFWHLMLSLGTQKTTCVKKDLSILWHTQICTDLYQANCVTTFRLPSACKHTVIP